VDTILTRSWRRVDHNSPSPPPPYIFPIIFSWTFYISASPRPSHVHCAALSLPGSPKVYCGAPVLSKSRLSVFSPRMVPSSSISLSISKLISRSEHTTQHLLPSGYYHRTSLFTLTFPISALSLFLAFVCIALCIFCLYSTPNYLHYHLYDCAAFSLASLPHFRSYVCLGLVYCGLVIKDDTLVVSLDSNTHHIRLMATVGYNSGRGRWRG